MATIKKINSLDSPKEETQNKRRNKSVNRWRCLPVGDSENGASHFSFHTVTSQHSSNCTNSPILLSFFFHVLFKYLTMMLLLQFYINCKANSDITLSCNMGVKRTVKHKNATFNFKIFLHILITLQFS